MSGADTGGTASGPDEERDLRAGEYVLGTLDPAEAQAMAEQARENAALAAAIAAWQARLAPLSRLATPVTPPPEVWNRIAGSAGLREAGQPAAVSPWRAFWDNAVLWRWTTGASLAAAVALLVVALQHPPAPPHQAAALLPTGGAIAAFLAEELPDGGLLLRAVTPVAVAVGKDLELWALPPGATRPISLGVIPAAAQRLAVPHPGVRLAQRTQLMVSLEPKGGSPTGQPTGQVLFAGTLTN